MRQPGIFTDDTRMSYTGSKGNFNVTENITESEKILAKMETLTIFQMTLEDHWKMVETTSSSV